MEDSSPETAETIGILRGTGIQKKSCPPACPVCNGPLVEIRAKLQCARCHTICETCCEGGRG